MEFNLTNLLNNNTAGDLVEQFAKELNNAILEKIKQVGNRIDFKTYEEDEEDCPSKGAVDFFDLPEVVDYRDMGNAQVFKVVAVGIRFNRLVFFGRCLESGNYEEFDYCSINNKAMIYDLICEQEEKEVILIEKLKDIHQEEFIIKISKVDDNFRKELRVARENYNQLREINGAELMFSQTSSKFLTCDFNIKEVEYIKKHTNETENNFLLEVELGTFDKLINSLPPAKKVSYNKISISDKFCSVVDTEFGVYYGYIWDAELTDLILK